MQGGRLPATYTVCRYVLDLDLDLLVVGVPRRYRCGGVWV
jgi:hypothetical protein